MSDLEDVVMKAGSAYADGRYEEALQRYQRAVLGHPNNGVLHANISAILLRLSRPEEALTHAETAVNLQPKWGKAYYRKGEALRRLGESRKALIPLSSSIRFESPAKQCFTALRECAKSVFKSFPAQEIEKLGLHEDAFALLATVGQLLLSEGALEDSVRILTWALQLDCVPPLKLRASALACLGSAHYRSGDVRRAIDYYEQQLESCLELGSGEVGALRNLAVAAEAAEEWELALRSRKKILRNQCLTQIEKNEERQAVGELLLQMERGEEALLILEKCSGKNIREKVNLACAWAATGDCGRSLNSLMPLRPECERLFSRVMEAVSRCLLEEGRLQEAVNYLNDVMEHAKTKGQSLVWKIACGLQCKNHLRMGSVAAALRLAKRLLRMGRECEDRDAEGRALRLLATAYEQQGDNSSLLLLQKFLNFTVKQGEQAKTHLDIARLMVKREMDPKEHLEKALSLVEVINDNKIKVQVYSAALRQFKARGEVLLAEDLLQRQNNLLHCDLDGTSRSLIFEDVAFMAAEEGGSSSSVTALEHSLADAQEANNVQREMELLELLGDELGKLGRRREAEGFYNRFLALAKQLRVASQIQRAHEKLASEFKLRGAWSLCADHARSALTVAKIQQDVSARTRMLLLIGEAETEKEEWETSICVLKKALGLAKAAQLPLEEAEAHRYLAVFHERRGEHKEERRHLEKYVETSPTSTPELCKALLNLMDGKGPAERISLLRQCRRVCAGLPEKEKVIYLRKCFSSFLAMNLADEAINCLRLMTDVDSELLRSLFEQPLPRQLGVLQFLSEKFPHKSGVHGRLMLLGRNETCSLDPTCSLISACKHNTWETVSQLTGSSIDLSTISSENLELLEMIANWKLCKTLPPCLLNLSVHQQLSLHRLSWSQSFAWQSVPSVSFRVRLLTGDYCNPLEEEAPLLEKIICALLDGKQKELVPMWYQEMVSDLGSKEYDPWDDGRREVAIAAAFLALAEQETREQIRILESSKWDLDRNFLSLHGLPPPPLIDLPFNLNFTYIYGLEEVDLIWVPENGRPNLYLTNLSTSPSFHIQLLSQFARRRGINNLPPSLPPANLMITNCGTTLAAGEVKPWFREKPPEQNRHRRIWLLSLSSHPLKGAVCCHGRPRSLALRKFADCHLAVVDASSAPSAHEIISCGSAPDVVITIDRLPFSTYSALTLMGCSVVVELHGASSTGIDLLIEQLRIGDPISLCVSHLSHWLLGDSDFRVDSDATLARLRHIVREDAASFLVLARSWRQGGRLGEPWADVARSLMNLSSEEIDMIIPLLAENDTHTVNMIYSNPKSTPGYELIEDGGFKKQFALLYSDHLFVEERSDEPPTVVKSKPSPRKVQSPEDSGYVSDGEYLVAAPRRQRTPGMTRSSATVISVHIPK